MTVDVPRIHSAIQQIENAQSLWLEGQWSQSLPDALAYLLSIVGIDVWMKRCPWATFILDPPLHAAGFRTEEMRRYRQIITMNVGGRAIHFVPEDANILIHEVHRLISGV